MKKLKSLGYFLIIFLFIGCGYSPIYKGFKNTNFSITINKTIGDENINNLFKSKFINYKFNNQEKNYNVIINSKYSKNIISKDTTGAATEFRLVVESSFKVDLVNVTKEFNYKESFDMNRNSDRLEEQDYEKIIKSNLVNIISNKFIIQLSQIK